MNLVRLAILSVCVLIGNLALAGDLTISATPESPVLIPYGQSTVNNHILTAPYFVVNQLHVKWAGRNRVSIAAILLTSASDSNVSLSCGIAGDDLVALFPQLNSSTGQIIISPGLPEQTSLPLACGSLTLPTPIPSTIKVPVTIKMMAVVLNEAGIAIDLQTAEAHIVVQ